MTNAEPQSQQATLTDVSAGGDVNVELQQVMIAVAEDPTARAAAQALLRGPLVEVGAEEDAQRAFELIEAKAHGEAAELFLRISAALSPEFKVVAEFFDHQAMTQFREAGEQARAAEVAVDLAEAQIARCDVRAVGSARTARQLLGDDDVLGVALVALVGGVETGNAGTQAIRKVATHYRGEAEEIKWAASLIERLVLNGEVGEAIEAAEDVRRRVALAGGARLMVELDYLDALIACRRGEDADAVIEKLTELAAEPRSDPSERALIQQRLGVALYTRERYVDSERAFFKAIEQWGWAKGSEDQIAECFFAAEECRLRRGEIHQEGFMLRPLAATLRGSNTHAASLGETLETRGLRYRVREKWADARAAYWQGYAVHRRAGDLVGASGCAAALAEVYEAANHAADAVRFYALAGDEKGASRVAPAVVDATAVAGQLPLAGSAHQRAASYAALAALGRRLDNTLAERLAPALLQEATGQASVFGPSPPRRALQALAELVCSLDRDLLQQVLDLLRGPAQSGDPDLARSASRGLIVATNVDLSDESELLLEIALSDRNAFGQVPTDWLASQLQQRPELRSEVVERARGGSRTALEIAAIAELIDDEILSSRCEEIVAASIGRANYQTKETESGQETSVSFAAYEDIGIFARYAPPASRATFFESALAVVLDGNDALVNRTSACNAIFNMAPKLTADQAVQAYDGLVPLALGQIGLSHVDLMSAGSADPFARFKVAFGAPEWLRSAAIVCLGRLDATHQDVDAAAVVQAILAEEPDPAVLESAFEAQAHLTLPIPAAVAQRGLRHPNAGVRAKALQAWGACRDELEDDVVERALADSELAVRITLMTIARHAGDTGVLERLRADSDALVRAYAVRHLRALAAAR